MGIILIRMMWRKSGGKGFFDFKILLSKEYSRFCLFEGFIFYSSFVLKQKNQKFKTWIFLLKNWNFF